MEHHTLWIVELVNRLLGPLVAPLLGLPYTPGVEVIPDYLVMCGLIVLGVTVFSLAVRSTFSVDNPGKLQIVLEDIVGFLNGLLVENIGPRGPQFLPLVGSIFIFIFTANAIGKIPGLMSPTANINVTLGCALTVWVYYHLQGVKAQGIVAYVKHFIIPPGVPLFVAPIMAPIELISHASRVMSLSLRRTRGAHHGEHHSVPRAATDDVPRRDHRVPAGVHLHAADDHLPRRRGPRRAWA
jgi:F-type H+-transporting ATPase subunit a